MTVAEHKCLLEMEARREQTYSTKNDGVRFVAMLVVWTIVFIGCAILH